jgi:putative ABC transport system substrate-binding protein
MKRREFILGSIAAAWPVGARAQQTTPVIGFLYQAGSDTDVNRDRFSAFRQGLGEAGYVEGNNLAIEYRAANRAEQLPELASELTRLNVRLIVAAGSEAGHAAQRATRTIPIVMAASSDPVGTGLVASLARPGGNITGMSLASPDLVGKRLELLREVAGDISLIAALWKSDDPPAIFSLREAELSAQKLHMKLVRVGVLGPNDFDKAITSAISAQAKALFIITAPIMTLYAGSIAELAARNRLPAISYSREFPQAGGLMSYGPSMTDSFRQSAMYVAKILKGEAPANLPVQQPTKFEFVINLKTAKELGLEVPLFLQQRADEVIE